MMRVPLNILRKLFFFFFFPPDPSGGLTIVDKVTNKMGKDKDNLEFHYLFCSVVVKNRFRDVHGNFKKGSRNGTRIDSFLFFQEKDSHIAAFWNHAYMGLRHLFAHIPWWLRR